LAYCWFINLVGLIGFIGLGDISLRNLGVSFISIGIVGIGGFSGQISLVSLIGLVGFGGIGGFSGLSLVSFIGLGVVGFVGLSLDSLGRLTGHISLVGRCIIGLIESAASSNHWPISLIGVLGLCLIASSASAASLARRLISFVGLIGSSTHRLFCKRLATATNKATKITLLNYTASHGVAALQISANKIVNTARAYYAASSLHICTFVREKMYWWLALTKKRCGCGLPLLVIPTTVTCNNTQNNYRGNPHKKLAKVKPLKCAGYLFGAMTKIPWHGKETKASHKVFIATSQGSVSLSTK
jgi:hypothetical protein